MYKRSAFRSDPSQRGAERPPVAGRASGVRAALARWRRRGASAVESTILTGTVALGAAAGYHAMGTSISTTIGCLGDRLMGNGSSCEGDPTIGPTAGSIRGQDPPLTNETLRITDDNVPPTQVTNDTPGANMETAGNATLTWVYGNDQVVGACKSLASHVGLSDPNALMSGGMCLQVGNYGTKFRVEDQLENWQDCGSAQHLDFHVGQIGHQQTANGSQYNDGPLGTYLRQNPSQSSYNWVNCGSPDSAITGIFRDPYANGGTVNDAVKQIRFDRADGPVTGAVLHLNGHTYTGTLDANGSFTFHDPSGNPISGTGTFDLTVQEPNGSTKTQHTTLNIPTSSQVHGTQVHGNDTNRGGYIDTLQVSQGESVQDALTRAQQRQQCITFLTQNKMASRQEAEKHGCAP